jgi:hypothetical protein
MHTRHNSRPHPYTQFDPIRARVAQVLTGAGHAPYRSQGGAIAGTGFETLPASTWPSVHVRVLHCQIPDAEEAAVLERLAETGIAAYNRHVDERNAQRHEQGRELADGYQRSLDDAGWTTQREDSGSLLATPPRDVLAAIPHAEPVKEFADLWNRPASIPPGAGCRRADDEETADRTTEK